MFDTGNIEEQMRLMMRNRIEGEPLARQVRTELARRRAQRRLRQEVERVLRTDGDFQSALAALDRISHEVRLRARSDTGTPSRS